MKNEKKMKKIYLLLILAASVLLIAALILVFVLRGRSGGGADTSAPDGTPAAEPTEAPTGLPTGTPTDAPTATPTEAPTEVPTGAPTEVPTETPTEAPTEAPTETPTEAPTEAPTEVPTEPLDPPAPEADISGLWRMTADLSGFFREQMAADGLGDCTPAEDLTVRCFLLLDSQTGSYEISVRENEFQDLLMRWSSSLLSACEAYYNGTDRPSFEDYLRSLGMTEGDYIDEKTVAAAEKFLPAGSELNGHFAYAEGVLLLTSGGGTEACALYSFNDPETLLIESYRLSGSDAEAPVFGLPVTAPVVLVADSGEDDPGDGRTVRGIDDSRVIGNWLVTAEAGDMFGSMMISFGGRSASLSGISLPMYLCLAADGTGRLITTPAELEVFASRVSDVVLKEAEKDYLARTGSGEADAFDRFLSQQGLTRPAYKKQLADSIRLNASGTCFTYAVREGRLYVSISMDTVYDTDYFEYTVDGGSLVFTNVVSSYYPEPFGGALLCPKICPPAELPGEIVTPGEVSESEITARPVDTSLPRDDRIVGTWTTVVDYGALLRSECEAQGGTLTVPLSPALVSEKIWVFSPDGMLDTYLLPADRELFILGYTDAAVASTEAVLARGGQTYEGFLALIGMTDAEYRAAAAADCEALLEPGHMSYLASADRLYIDFNTVFVGDANEFTLYHIDGSTLTAKSYSTSYAYFYTGIFPYYPCVLERAEAEG